MKTAIIITNKNNNKGRATKVFQNIQKIKGKFKARLGMLKDQYGNTLTEHDKIKMGIY